MLCVALLDDRAVERVLPTLSERRLGTPTARQLGEIMRGGSWASTLRGLLATVLVVASLLVTLRELRARCRATIAPEEIGEALRVEREKRLRAGAARCSTPSPRFTRSTATDCSDR